MRASPDDGHRHGRNRKILEVTMNEEIVQQVNRDWQELVRSCGGEYVLTQEEGFATAWLAAEATRLGVCLEQLHEILEAI